MNAQAIVDTMTSNQIKSKVITTILGYKLVSINLNSKVTFPRLLEVVANSQLDKAVEVKQFGKTAMVYFPTGKE